jgi:tetratricopeptide (TPR) repeat protein
MPCLRCRPREAELPKKKRKKGKMVRNSLAKNVLYYALRGRKCAVLAILSILILFPFGGELSSYGRGGQPVKFLSWGAGARSLGLGKAYIAIADEASATYWNPAALVQLDRFEITGLFTSLWDVANYSFVGFVCPTAKYGNLGLSIVRLSSGEFEKYTPVYDMANPTEIIDFVKGTFDVSDTAVILSYSKKVKDKLSIGIGTKYINRKVDTYVDSYLSADVYLFIERLNGFPLKIGAAVQNLLWTRLTGESYDVIPFNFRIGIGYRTLKNKLLFSFDLQQDIGIEEKYNVRGGNLSFHAGCEYLPLNFVALRIGFEGEYGIGIREPTAGIGIKYGDYRIDYALGLHVGGLMPSHRISASWRFGRSVLAIQQEEVRRAIEKGLEAYRAGDYSLALQHFNKANDIDPSNREAKHMSEKLSLVVSIFPEMKETTREAEIIRNAINSYIEGDYKTAVNGFRYAYSLQPQNESLLKMLNLVEKEAKMPQTMPERVPSPIGAEPLTLVARKLYAALQYIYNREYDKAVIECQEVLKLEPNNETALERLGSALYMMGEKEKAKEVWLRVLEINPNNKVVLEFLKQLGVEVEKK